jgi:tRNA(Ile)-lysidine synthase
MNTDIIEKYHMLPRGGRVLCAVSGGADSMCLLHYLWSNREALGIEVCAAHFDHQLRGLESARDRTFVKDWCRTNGIELGIGFGR